MNRFLKQNSHMLGWLAGALLLILIAFYFRPNPPVFHLNASETMQLMNDPSMSVTIDELAGKQAIDIRTSELFESGHAPNAINIPVRQLLDKESIKLFKKLKADQKAVVLYGSTELQAVSPWLMLQQLGYRNILRLKGAFDTEHKLYESDLSAIEKILPDTSVFHSSQAIKALPATAAVGKKQEAVQLQKRETTKSGGC